MGFFNVNMGLLPMKIHYFLFDGGNSPINPFLSTIAKQRGYSSMIVGNIFTCLLLLNIVIKPLTGYVTDKWKCRRTVFLGSILLNGLLTFALNFVPGATSPSGAEISDREAISSWTFWLFATVVTLRMMVFMVGEILQETICVGILGENTQEYGAQRLWGAIGWGTMSFVAGTLVDWYSAGLEHKNYLPGYLLSMTVFMIDFVVALRLKVSETETRAEDRPVTEDKVLNKGKLFLFLVWATFGGILFSYICLYFLWYVDDLVKLYHPERKPLLNTIQGLSLTIQCVIGDVPVLYFSGQLIKFTGHMVAISISFAVYALRFITYSIIRDPLWILPVEALNGITFGLFYVTCISYAVKIAPPGKEGTIQGLFFMAYQGFGGALGTTLAGYTFSHMGSIMAYRLMGFVALIVSVATILNKCYTKFF